MPNPTSDGERFSIEPVLNSQTGNLFKVADVGGEEYALIDQRDRGDLEVHCSDANLRRTERVELARRTIIKGNDRELGLELEEQRQFLIGGYLAL